MSRNMFNRKYILKLSILHCYASLPECTSTRSSIFYCQVSSVSECHCISWEVGAECVHTECSCSSKNNKNKSKNNNKNNNDQ